ncbi:hypothetical protein OCK74_05215 [Chitinophagaceae bacterium LB-8]|uniref:Polysaccharide chain length determinant N-terminal domain-containing protein n=1 Tax=Paraflavisolibacter caeni TaxID=2982496 RepID=A0A9X2XND7_9BACT|nr:hypothetical protein [Paraflavisolibacter caeni]MCU7548503.1 hypothetical protein [Paraflavisolibacter caeni]
MESTEVAEYTLVDILNGVRTFINYLLSKWWLVLLFSCVGAGLGIVYFYIQKPKYEAACTFVLEEKQSGMAGLSGLASQFGIDIGGLSGGGSIFAGDNILDILKSKKVVTLVLLSKIENHGSDSLTLADLYLDFTGRKKKWEKDPQLAAINFKNANLSMSPVQDSVLNVIYKTIIKKNLSADRFNKKGTIIKVQVTAENDCFARLMAERLVDEASKMYLNIKTGTALVNINRMQRRSDSLLALLNNKSYVAAAVQPLDANPGITTARVPVEIASRDKTVIATLYTEVTKNLEASKMILAQQTPIIQVLDKPDLTLDDNKKGLFLIIIISLFFTNFIVISFLAILYYLKIIASAQTTE